MESLTANARYMSAGLKSEGQYFPLRYWVQLQNLLEALSPKSLCTSSVHKSSNRARESFISNQRRRHELEAAEMNAAKDRGHCWPEEWVLPTFMGAHLPEGLCSGRTQLACFQMGCHTRTITMRQCLYNLAQGRPCSIFAVKRMPRWNEYLSPVAPQVNRLKERHSSLNAQPLSRDSASEDLRAFRDAMIGLPARLGHCGALPQDQWAKEAISHFGGRLGLTDGLSYQPHFTRP